MASPVAGDVREGVTYTDSDGSERTGTLVLPDPTNVLEGVLYGAMGIEYTGTFQPNVFLVPIEDQLDLVRGDSKTLKWSQPFVDLSEYEFIFALSYGELIRLEVEGTWDGSQVSVSLLPEDTRSMASRNYAYGLRAYKDDLVLTLARGRCSLSMAYADAKD